jgi:hypothetical protein
MTAEVAMSIIHVTEACRATIVGLWAHVSVVPLTSAQDTVAPLGAFFVGVVCAILLALAAVETSLTLSLSPVLCMLVALLLCYVSDGGIVNEGSTNSTMITPCHSLSVAVVGTVVVTSLIMSLNGVINMATIVCSG